MSPRPDHAPGPGSSGLWYGLALLACLSVVFINGGGLTYFDTAGYLAQGHSTLLSLGLASLPEASGTGAGAASAPADDGVVVGSRAVVFSAALAVLNQIWSVNILPVFYALLLLLTVGLPARIALRTIGLDRALAPTIALPVIVACLTALPFYVAYLMPDLFAPVLLLMLATLAGFGPVMTWPERLLAVALGVLAVVTHPSHLLIVAAMLPVVAIGALLVRRRGWWIGPLLVAVILAGGLGERLLFVSAVKTIRGSEVVYQPFLTVRVIADGPGYAFLEDTCPDDTQPTCALYEALQLSDDDYRLTASHIMFERSERLGSYRRLPPEVQKIVADDQLAFFFSVLRDRPFGVSFAFIRNAFLQAGKYNSIAQTIPTTPAVDNVYKMAPQSPAWFRDQRLLDKRADLAWLYTPHRLFYALSALGLLVLSLAPRSGLSPALRVFSLTILLGILANALICGGISQPSDRYGARVAFLLPLVLILIYLLRPTDPDTTGP